MSEEGGDLSGAEWKYVNVRRLSIYLEHSIDSGTQWAVFEPNDEHLWAKVRVAVGAFMDTLYQAALSRAVRRRRRISCAAISRRRPRTTSTTAACG